MSGNFLEDRMRPAPTRPPFLSTQSSPALDASTGSKASSSTFGSVKSSISRKKPLGLDISKSIPKPTRSASSLFGGPAVENGGDSNWIPEADRLRDEIARLQLSSKSSSSSYASGPDSPPPPDSPAPPSSAGAPPPRPPRRVQSGQTTPTTSTKQPPPAAVQESGSGGGGGSKSSHSSHSSHTTSSHSHRKHSKTNGKRKKNDDDLVKDEDLEVLADLGAGNGGTVTKVWNKKRKSIMAKKLILVDAKPSVRKQILRELQIVSECNSPHIVAYYGCFPSDVHVGIVMEFMDLGSLDHIYRRTGAIPIDIVGKVAEAVLRGLVYLYDVHRIIHRDIKPSNILANTAGQIKICDFGVAGELINSIANTFVGTSTYMSPERIQGAPYSIKSDVWSLGISLVELAQGRFPFADPPESGEESEEEYDPDPTLPVSAQRPNIPSEKRHRKRGVSLGGGGMTMSILDLLQHIVNEPAPRLSTAKKTFPAPAEDFIDGCLDKDPILRRSPQELLESEWIRKSSVTPDEMKAWAEGVAQ